MPNFKFLAHLEVDHLPEPYILFETRACGFSSTHLTTGSGYTYCDRGDYDVSGLASDSGAVVRRGVSVPSLGRADKEREPLLSGAVARTRSPQHGGKLDSQAGTAAVAVDVGGRKSNPPPPPSVSHIVEGSLTDSKEPGEWVAALYNRDQGCTEDDLRQFIGTLDGVVPEEGNGGKAVEHGGEPSSRDRPVLPDGYTTIDQVGSYKWHLEQKGWDEAEATCQSEGGHLVVINSDKEALFVLDLFSSQKGEVQTDLKSSHYGVRDNEQDGSFVTIYGTPLSETGYERWARGQPDDENGVEFCIELLRNGEFNDEPCFKELPFICEIIFH
uniref:C-type lectin domain-containing protein n=1 Tax=Timema poppense TaxID=170557 RepID=A0A7R9CZD4_TIMPO|nr:unnamed protein product [Timema poppensis]